MQVDTRIIQAWTKAQGEGVATLANLAGTPIPRPEKPWKELKVADARRATGFDKPSFQQHITQEMLDADGVEIFGKPYSFNTKYVVSVEADDVIGSIIGLANGKEVWVDMAESTITNQCNRR